MVCLMRRLPFQ